jgi:uncharacterized protein YcfL
MVKKSLLLKKYIIIINFHKEKIYISYNLYFYMPRGLPFVKEAKKVLKSTKMYITSEEKSALTDEDGNTTIPVTKHYLLL